MPDVTDDKPEDQPSDKPEAPSGENPDTNVKPEEAPVDASASADGKPAEPSMEDDWAAAMAEQETTDAAEANKPQTGTPAGAGAGTPAGAGAGGPPPTAQIFPSFNDTASKATMMNELDMILDIPVQISVELGRSKITIKNLLQLAHGSVVELEAMAGEPMSVFVNGTLIAQGEVVVVNDKFGIRLTDIITPSERMRKLGR